MACLKALASKRLPQGATKWRTTAATTHVPMAMTAPVHLFGKTPRVISARTASTAILAKSPMARICARFPKVATPEQGPSHSR